MKQHLTKIVISFFLLASLSPAALSDNVIPDTYWATIEELIEVNEGDIIYIDFWASWCGPCVRSFPWLNSMQKQHGKDGLKIVAINVDSERELALEFLKKHPANFAVHYDPDGKFASLFNLPGMPSSYLANAKGQILAHHAGFREKKIPDYESKINELLKK